MGWTFVESREFTENWEDYFETDASYLAFQAELLADTEAGDVMPGCGGVRKMRWRDARRGKGKRGGLRVLYMRLPEFETIVLLDLYDKSEADDLTARQKRLVAENAARIRRGIAAQKQKERTQ